MPPIQSPFWQPLARAMPCKLRASVHRFNEPYNTKQLMKPYIAILIDSFWEAVGNKVLWALLIGWSLLLLALAPFGYVSERSFQLSSADIANRTQLIEKLARGAKRRGPQSIQAVAKRLDADFLEQLEAAAEDDSGGKRRALASSQLASKLNAAVNARDLYSEEVFPTAQRRKRLKPLIETPADELTEGDVEELNRELLQLAFPMELNLPRGEQLWIGYAGFKLGEPLPVSRRQINQFLEPLLLGIVIKLGLGILAVFIAIIVTSPMIPDTFRSGSLHLLLSKPISRVWLYLSKFFGGCIFVLVNITFVLIGLYLIAGFRFEIWNNGLLACIPLLMFVFVIFYSVSALVGLMWGNAIVCVVSCMVFWFLCFSIGFMHDAMLPQVEVMPQISKIREIDGHLMSVNEKGDLGVWNEEFSVWQPAAETNGGRQVRTFGPIYDEENQQIVVKSFIRLPFGNLAARSRKLTLIQLTSTEQTEPASQTPKSENDAEYSAPEASSLTEDEVDEDEEETTQQSDAARAKPEEDNGADAPEAPRSASETRQSPLWLSDQGPELPAKIFELVKIGDTIVAVCRGGLFKLDLNKLGLIEASEKGLFGIKIPWGAMTSAFENVAPKDYYLSENSYAAVTAKGDGLVVFSSGNVDHLHFDGEQFTLVHDTKLEGEGDGTEAAIAQMNKNYCVVARDGLPIAILDAQLKHTAEVTLPGEATAKQMAWIPGTDSLAIITHTGDFFRLECESAKISEIASPFSGKCTCMTWLDQSQVWLGVRPNRVYLLDVPTGKIEKELVPQSTTLENIFWWIVKPLYLVNPKPAALDNAMGYLLSGNETQSLSGITNDLEAAQVELDVWRPIVSNLAFVAVMLGVGCIYVARKEF